MGRTLVEHTIGLDGINLAAVTSEPFHPACLFFRLALARVSLCRQWCLVLAQDAVGYVPLNGHDVGGGVAASNGRSQREQKMAAQAAHVAQAA